MKRPETWLSAVSVLHEFSQQVAACRHTRAPPAPAPTTALPLIQTHMHAHDSNDGGRAISANEISITLQMLSIQEGQFAVL